MQSIHDLKKLLSDPDEEVRLLGLRELVRFGVKSCLPALYEALGDNSWRVRKEAVQIFLSFPSSVEYVSDVVEFLHSEDNAGLRNAAAEILSLLGRPSVPALVEKLGTPDHDVRKFALDILGEIGDESSLSAILNALRDPDLNVRAAAAENLGKLRVADAVPPLLDAMSEEDLWFRFTILEALGQIGAEIPTERLLPFFGEKLLRKALVDSLGKVGDTDSLGYLVESLVDDMRNVREAAVTAILRLVERFPEVSHELARFSGTPTAEAVAELLASHNLSLRSAVLRVLGMIGDGRFSVHILNHSEEESLRQDVVRALIAMGSSSVCPLLSEWEGSTVIRRVLLAHVFGETGCVESTPALIKALASPEDDLRLVSAHALGKLATLDALPSLVHMLSDYNEEIRGAALGALLCLGEKYREETITVLQPFLVDEDPEVRASAVLVLGRLDGPDVEKSISFALKDESALVRQAVVRTFEGKSGIATLEMLMLALTDEDAEVRRLAVEALGITSDSRALPPLELAISDDDLWVRSTAVRALGKFHDSEAERMIIRAMDDPIGLVVIAALETLAAKGVETSTPHLLKALDHPDEEVVNAALHFLSAGGGTGWIAPSMRNLINHPHWEVRNSFIRLLGEMGVKEARTPLESRLLLEDEEIVRQNIRDVLLFLGEGER